MSKRWTLLVAILLLLVPIVSATCAETDAGDDPEQGSTTDGNPYYSTSSTVSWIDYCVSTTTLIEYYCGTDDYAYVDAVDCADIDSTYTCITDGSLGYCGRENHAPEITSSHAASGRTEGNSVTIVAAADDVDGDSLTFVLNGITCDSETQSDGDYMCIWQTDLGDAGDYTATVTVSDGELMDEVSISFTVAEVAVLEGERAAVETVSSETVKAGTVTFGGGRGTIGTSTGLGETTHGAGFEKGGERGFGVGVSTKAYECSDGSDNDGDDGVDFCGVCTDGGSDEACDDDACWTADGCGSCVTKSETDDDCASVTDEESCDEDSDCTDLGSTYICREATGHCATTTVKGGTGPSARFGRAAEVEQGFWARFWDWLTFWS